jgi:hypothetical protein
VIQIGKNVNERNLADVIYSFTAKHKVGLTLLLQRYSYSSPSRPPERIAEEFGESPLEKSIPFLLKSAMRLG